MSTTSRGPLAGFAVVERVQETSLVAIPLSDTPSMASPTLVERVFDEAAVLRGSEGDDVFAPDAASAARRTTEGDDRVKALGGNDTVSTGGGNDTVRAGGGNDAVQGGAGDDSLAGGDGNDTLQGSAGSDQLVGGAGNDVLIDDEFFFLSGHVAYADTFSGGAGDDSITLGTGDSATGGTGNDQFFSEDFYNTGNKVVSIDAGSGDDVLSLTGSLGQGSVLLGGSGSDVIYLKGSNFTDEYEYHPEATGTLFDGGTGDDSLRLRGSMVGAQSTLIGGLGNDTLTGVGHLLITAGDGDDVIVGGGTGGFRAYLLANDIDISSGSGRDTLTPMPSIGVDPVRVLDFAAGPGGDLLDLMPMLGALAGHFNYAPPGGFAGWQPFESGRVQLLAQGADTLVQYYSADPFEVPSWTTAMRLVGVLPEQLTVDNFLPGQAPGGDHVARDLVGSNFDDTLTGYSGDDSLLGLNGNDLLDGGFGGHDSLVGDYGADQLFGFDGDDVLDGGDGGDLLSGDDGNDSLSGGDGDDGGQFSGVLHGVGVTAYGVDGGGGDDLVDGGAGNDTVVGGGGADTVLGGDGDDTLYDGYARSSTAYGDGDHDELDGGAGNDRMFVAQTDHAVGGSGNDHISYEGGDVTIDAGDGDDVIDTRYGQSVIGLATVSTGSGADIVAPGVDGDGEYANQQIRLTVTDFDIGSRGDRIDLVNVNRALHLADDADPFTTGRARLTEANGATHLELDMDKNHNTWVRVLSLNGVDADAMTSDNFVQAVHPVVGPAGAAADAGALQAADVLDLGGAGMITFGVPSGATLMAAASSAPPLTDAASATATTTTATDALAAGNPLHAAWSGGGPVWQHELLASHAGL